jgi:hypothetical protein
MAEKTITRTYNLRSETAQRVKDLATTREVWDSSLVDYLLTYALDAVETGDLTFTRRPVAWVIDRGDGQE